MVEYATKHFEQIATSTELESRSPALEQLDIRSGRFFMLAANLEMQRQTNADKELIRKTREALFLASRNFKVQSGLWGMWRRDTNRIEDTGALESWSDEQVFRDPNQTIFKNPTSRKLQERLAKKLSSEEFVEAFTWPNVELPSLDSPAVEMWLRRQVLLGRNQLALSYVTRADGSLIARARVLALLGEVLVDIPDSAKACIRISNELVKSIEDSIVKNDSVWACLNESEKKSLSWEVIETKSRIAMAFQAVGDSEQSRALTLGLQGEVSAIAKASKFDPESATRDSIFAVMDHSAFRSVLRSVCEHQLEKGDVAPVVVLGIKHRLNSHLADETKYSLVIRDFEHIVDHSKLYQWPERYRYESHLGFYEAFESKRWAKAANEVLNLAKGNPAWLVQLEEVALKSVDDLGLEKTLEWVSAVKDEHGKLVLESDAVRHALEPQDKIISIRAGRYRSTIYTIAPGIMWPSNGC